MHTPGKESKDPETTGLEQDLAKALASLKPFRLNKTWIRQPKTDSEIGVGGFGVVHRAVLRRWLFSPKVYVAVKKLYTTGEWKELLLVALALVQELDVWAKLDHPNILRLVGFHLSSKLDEAWLVSPYESNGNVHEYLERTQLGLDSRLELAKDTAKGLEYLHTRTPPICHGDIKSLNVLIDASGHAMLCDFGLAKAVDASAASTKSKIASGGGTIRYWSPERFDDNSHPTLKSDIWGWGCLLLEIVTGLLPYHDILMEGRLIHLISNGRLPATLDNVPCPPHIRDLLVLCWRIEPESRPIMTQLLSSLIAGNMRFCRSESLPPTPSASSIHLDNMERELADMLALLKKYRTNPAWYSIPTLDSPLGSGGFGVVHRARMRQGRRGWSVPVAVKKLRGVGGRDKCLRMVIALIREVGVWASLSHPNIIPFIGFYLSPQLQEAWLVAPLMIHGNLSEYLLGFSMSTERRLILALDTAEGLRYLHNHDPPICHGDIKALNVLINMQLRAVLCDFGLAKVMESMPSGLTTSTFNQAGSLTYESPELLLGTSLRTLESDVWAWGCLLQEIFSGKTPYHWANNVGAVVKFITQNIPPAVLDDVECTPLVRQVLVYCWQSRPVLRPSMDQCVAIITDELSHHRDDGYEGNVSSIFQELESKLDIVLIEDLVVKRSHLNFGEASMMGPDSFGTVYKGEMLREPSAPGSVVAIRRLLPSVGRTEIPDEVIKRFISRLRSKHVNILQIAGYCTDPSPTGEIFLIHPYVSTGSLDTYLGRNALDHTRKMALATEIAEGLLYLHTRSPRIIHGHLHPRNILVNDTGHPLLCDYGFNGFVRYFKTAPASLERLRYQCPEAVLKASSSSARGDVWSWGCIFLLIISGRVPYHNVKGAASLRRRLRQKTNPVPLDDLNCDPRHINLLDKCWAWDPPSRLAMADVVAILTGKSFKIVKAWSTRIESLCSLRFSRNGEVLAVGSSRSIAMHNTQTGDILYELDLPDTKAEHYGMQFSGSGRFLGVVLPPDVLVWDLATREIRETRTFDRAVLVELDISSDDKFCVLGCENGVIHIWDIDDKESCRSTSLDGELRSLAISPGREVVAVGMRDSGVHLLSTRTFEALVRLDCQWIWTLRFSPDGDLLFGAGAERLARCWDVSSIKLETPGDMRQVPGLSFRGHKRIISSVSGNSAWLMSISDGGEVHAVNLATEAARGETQQIGSLPQTSVGHRMDLGPVSAEGSGYAVAHPGGSDKLIVWNYASLLHRKPHSPRGTAQGNRI